MATSFGIMTPPMNVDYADLVRVWREADELAEFDHAWLFDHLMAIGGDPDGPAFEGWTLLSALAAQTTRLRLGLLVTSNRFRPPAMLAKIAATVDVVSGGRLDFGIGAGSRPSHPAARREYDAHGLPYLSAAEAVRALDESLSAIRRLWDEAAPFDVDGEFVTLTGAFGNPKPVQRPRPPIVIGGRSTATLRVAARHADTWNMPGGSLADAVERSARLDQLCVETGRDPNEVTRSVFVPVDHNDPARSRAAVTDHVDAGFTHVVLGMSAPYPAGAAQRVADEVVRPLR